MKTNYELRYAAHPEDAKQYDTKRIRRDFLIEKVFTPNEVNMVYSMYDRMIVGGAMPAGEVLVLEAIDPLKAPFFLTRREMGIFNVGGPGVVKAGDAVFELDFKEALYLGIENAVAGKHIGDIGHAVQAHCESRGYGVVRELTGHGIGREMHEDPSVPNYGTSGSGVLLKAGMCIAIEPMITMGDRSLCMMPDRWTIKTCDGKPAAHFEHTVAIYRGKAEILSSFEEVERLERN